MQANRIDGASFAETGYSYTLSLINGKYKPIILYCLMEYEPVRFNEMQRYLGRVSDKTLSMHLKELEGTVWCTGRCTRKCRRGWSTRSRRAGTRS